jgi:hypothetical protein
MRQVATGDNCVRYQLDVGTPAESGPGYVLRRTGTPPSNFLRGKRNEENFDQL